MTGRQGPSIIYLSVESLPHLVDRKALLFDCGGGPFIPCWKDALLGGEPTTTQNLDQSLVVISIINLIVLFAYAGSSCPNVSMKISLH